MSYGFTVRRVAASLARRAAVGMCAAAFASGVFFAATAEAGSVGARERSTPDRLLGDVLSLTTKNGFAMKVGGYANLAYVYGLLEDKEGSGVNDSNVAQDGVFQDAEIHFAASKKIAAYDTEIGYKIQLESASKSSDQVDEHYGYIKSSLGELIVGAENDAAFLLQVHAPNFVGGLSFYANNYSWLENAHRPNDGALSLDIAEIDEVAAVALANRRVALPAAAYGVAEEAGVLSRSRPGGQLDDAHYETRHARDAINDANKLTYKTPRLYGVQAGLSYVPSSLVAGGDEGGLARDSRFDHVIGYGLNYKGKFEGVSVAASFGHLFDDAGDGDTPFEEFSVGAQVGYGPVKVGGSWILRRDWDLFLGTDSNGFHVAASTKLDFLPYPLIEDTVLGIGYTRTEVSGSSERVQVLDTQGTAALDDDTALASFALGELAGVDQVYQSVQFGGQTKLAKGVSIGYFWQWSDQQFAGNYYQSNAHHFLGVLMALKF